MLKDVRTWVALAIGAIAWTPLIVWNLDNADAGLRFQLVDRHPWNFHFDGAWFFVVQALLATPLLFAAMAHAAVRGWHGQGADDRNHAKYFALIGGGTVVAFCLLGFFADNERISFHWTLAGPVRAVAARARDARAMAARMAARDVGARGRRAWSRCSGITSSFPVPAARARFAAAKWYPANFAGWDALADAVRDERAKMPPDTRIVADNFKIGAELGFALDDPRSRRAAASAQHAPRPRAAAAMCGSCSRTIARRSASVRCCSSSVHRKCGIAICCTHYHALCDLLGPLPPPRVVNIDHGRQRFVLFRMPAKRASGECTAPAMAYIDSPLAKARVSRDFEVAGWAFKDGVGIARVEVTLDGEVIGLADYGQQHVGIRGFWRESNDPQHPYVAWTARVRAGAVSAGRALARAAPDRARRQRRTMVRTTAAHRRLNLRAGRTLPRATCARSRSSAGRSARWDPAFRSHRTRRCRSLRT